MLFLDLDIQENHLQNKVNKEVCMTKEVVQHRKDDKKKPTMTAKERKAKKQEKKKAV